MTTLEQAESPSSPEEEINAYYQISAERLDELNRSFEMMLLSRRCRSCKEQAPDLANPPSAKDQIKHIVGCCGQDETFIRPGMPIQEIVFRLLLSGGNRPMSLEGIHYNLSERWATPDNPMAFDRDGLKRVLDADDFYGFVEVPAEEAERR